MGVTGLETAFAVLYTELVLPGVLDLATVVERLRAGAEPLRLRAPADRARRARRTSSSSTSTPSGRPAPRAGRAARDNSCFAGRRLRGRVLMTVAAGRVAYRQRSFAMGVA